MSMNLRLKSEKNKNSNVKVFLGFINQENLIKVKLEK